MTKKLILTGVCVAAVLLLSSHVFAAESDEEIRVRRLQMTNETATVRVNQERTLLVDVLPRDADNKELEWSSSNPEVVTVDVDGVITGVSPGTAVITATSHNRRTATCTVTVPASAMTEIEQQVKNEDSALASIEHGEALGAEALKLQVQKAAEANPREKTVTLTYTDKTTVSSAALRAAAFTADYHGVEAVLRFRTLDENGNIQGQLTIDPDKAGEADRDIRLRVYTGGTEVESARKNAAARFGGSVQAVRLSQTGDFGMTVEAAARSALGETAGKSLTVCRYFGGAYEQVAGAGCYVDNNGFVRFTVSKGGTYIIVSQ